LPVTPVEYQLSFDPPSSISTGKGLPKISCLTTPASAKSCQSYHLYLGCQGKNSAFLQIFTPVRYDGALGGNLADHFGNSSATIKENSIYLSNCHACHVVHKALNPSRKLVHISGKIADNCLTCGRACGI
jgi:hypothetical protein